MRRVVRRNHGRHLLEWRADCCQRAADPGTAALEADRAGAAQLLDTIPFTAVLQHFCVLLHAEGVLAGRDGMPWDNRESGAWALNIPAAALALL
jgi:hypothetical protein